MEKSEPALVPQWLRTAGSVASSAPHFASSSNHTGNLDVLTRFRIFNVLCSSIENIMHVSLV
jgi:hypothetical protein